MNRPKLYIMAGAPGSGKSRSFPVSEFGVEFFNADDRAAELNHGSYHDISLELRSKVNREFESFISVHIEARKSFAFETTLRSSIIFEQMSAANAQGFEIVMRYIGISDLAINLERIAIRWDLGFHAAPTDVLTAIHAKSHENLIPACKLAYSGHMTLLLYDNSEQNRQPLKICEISEGTVRILRHPLPLWAASALEGIEA